MSFDVDYECNQFTGYRCFCVKQDVEDDFPFRGAGIFISTASYILRYRMIRIYGDRTDLRFTFNVFLFNIFQGNIFVLSNYSFQDPCKHFLPGKKHFCGLVIGGVISPQWIFRCFNRHSPPLSVIIGLSLYILRNKENECKDEMGLFHFNLRCLISLLPYPEFPEMGGRAQAFPGDSGIFPSRSCRTSGQISSRIFRTFPRDGSEEFRGNKSCPWEGTYLHDPDRRCRSQNCRRSGE